MTGTIEVRNVWHELQTILIEKGTISIENAVSLTWTSWKNIPKIYKIENNELLILMGQDGKPARFGGHGASGVYFQRAIDVKTEVLKDFRENLRAWENGTTESAESDLALVTKELISRAV